MPFSSHRFQQYTIVALIMANLIIDQVSKYIVRTMLAPHQVVEVIGHYLVFMRVENAGAFMSIGEGIHIDIKFLFLSLLPLLLLVAVIYVLMRYRNLPVLLRMGLSLVAGGGFGNLFDRFQFGSVTDFLRIDFLFIQTGIFNIADISIFIGICCLAGHIYQKKLSKRRRIMA